MYLLTGPGPQQLSVTVSNHSSLCYFAELGRMEGQSGETFLFFIKFSLTRIWTRNRKRNCRRWIKIGRDRVHGLRFSLNKMMTWKQTYLLISWSLYINSCTPPPCNPRTHFPVFTTQACFNNIATGRECFRFSGFSADLNCYYISISKQRVFNVSAGRSVASGRDGELQ